jgi:hypothetical protein
MNSSGKLLSVPAGSFAIISTHPFGSGGIQNNSKKLHGDILILVLETCSDPIWGVNSVKVLVGGEVGYISTIGLKEIEL